MAKKTCLVIGGSGRGGGMIKMLKEQFNSRMEIVGVVDVKQDVLEHQGKALGLGKTGCSPTLTRHVPQSRQISVLLQRPRNSTHRPPWQLSRMACRSSVKSPLLTHWKRRKR